MCYHSSIPNQTELDELLDYAIRTDEWDEYFNYMNGYDHKPLPVLKMEDPTKISKSNWGLVASWAKDKSHADMLRKSCLNAKSEDIFDTASYRNVIRKKRCLIFLNGFYEWREIGKKEKYPYFISLKDQKAFACAGIYETWNDKNTGEVRETCSMVTTTANPLMAKIHNVKQRMPVIYTKAEMFNWIQPHLTDEQIKALMKPLDESLMQAHTVTKINPKTPEVFNIPEVKLEVEYPQITLLDSD
ncbi:MAG: SOS response-associated peptidase [Bacteroidota bacterium]|nr:SOS response-associated peptidase [Bacteroidota bacterium]